MKLDREFEKKIKNEYILRTSALIFCFRRNRNSPRRISE